MDHFSKVALLGVLSVLTVAASPACADTGKDTSEIYTFREASRDGIGKVYMDREISFVLGHRGIRWLEREERAVEEQPDRLVELLDLDPGTVIADVGAGSGYLTFLMQPKVPEGKVIAVDIQPEMLDAVKSRRDREGITNVETVLGTESDPGLPEGSIDAALMVDAYHEFSHPREMMEGLVRALKPGGTIFLVEYRAEDPDVPMLPLHKMTVEQARREMAVVGLEFLENRKGLPWQHILVFRKPAGAERSGDGQ